MLNVSHRVLVLAPHTDDGELGSGGTIARFIAEGKSVFYVAFSAAGNSVPEGFPRDILKREVHQATKVLGIPTSNLKVLSYPVRNFPSVRQQILEDMLALRKEINPDLVLLPSLTDTHQDHQVIAQEGFRAFKFTTMLGYEMLWNNRSFPGDAYIVFGEEQLQKKIEALKCYQSQQSRLYFDEEFLRAWARTRGTLVAQKYAEAFEVIRWVLH